MQLLRVPGILLLVLGVSLCVAGQRAARSVCDYYPPESRVRDLSLQGWFNWHDGPYVDDRDRSRSTDVVVDYGELSSSSSFGHTIDARAEIRGTSEGWTEELAGSASLRTHTNEDVFLVGALGLDASSVSGLELDVTGGIGSGRFRNVTPLAQAIRVQNELLDLGELLAPVGDDMLLELAQILGDVASTDDEKTIRVTERLVETGLTSGEQLGVRGLLAIEEIVGSQDQTRLCGRDIQARLGASARIAPQFDLAATGILLARFAAVPDPISQVDSDIEVKMRLAHPDELNVEADLSYTRRLPGSWSGRAEYRLVVDRMWTDRDLTTMAHRFSASLSTQVLTAVGLSFTGDAEYETGDEEISFTLTVQLEADLL